MADTPATTDTRTRTAHPAAWYVLAAARLLIGFEFLWAFLDKTFGWTFSTPAGPGMDQRRLAH